jgi:hypothetical protein
MLESRKLDRLSLVSLRHTTGGSKALSRKKQDHTSQVSRKEYMSSFRLLVSWECRRRCRLPVTVQLSHIGVGSIIAFLVGWWIFGFLGAILLAIIVLVLMGVIRIR